ncbi:hypothetical protein VTN77DRAFT_6816 [Rasamsonia byssochlamydoides]|uniref:uncharacterized protein n=1 Tax=Rasamsonia byssochlamydoides TaxID=89139 RepID=UPI003743191F
MPTPKKSTSTKTAKVSKSAKVEKKVPEPTQSSSSSSSSASSSAAAAAAVAPPESPALSRLHKRSRMGCYTCRLRRKKCDEAQPACRACTNLCIKCEYKRPIWWSNSEQRKIQKERVKNKIKQTKLNERNGTFADRMASSMGTSPFALEFDFNRPPFFTQPYDPFGSHLPTPALGPNPYAQFGPYEVDVKTERQTFINDIPTRHDSSISTFNTFAPPYLHATLPPFPSQDWYREEHFNLPPPYGVLDPALGSATTEQSWTTLQSMIPVDDQDRPLLNHFVDNVLRLAFPILDVHQQGAARARAILHSLETNKCYLHCCLSAAAIHRKTTEGLTGESVDYDIVRHRYHAVRLLCQALDQDTNHEQILEAALAMIFFHCSVGTPEDYLPDIPWSGHFQAVIDLVDKLDLPREMIKCNNIYRQPPFNMTLTAWIDILGATMLGQSPQFAHLYRTKYLSGTPSGLRELMGCDDRVMYLISEIACLDALKSEGLIDDMSVCSHVSALGNQLEFTEPPDQILEHPYSPVTGALRPDQLTKNISSIFRTAARIYLCSLVPGFDRNQPSNLNLVAAVSNMLQFIPGGSNGFDRCIVWPLLIAGAFSVPSSPFRAVLEERVIALGDHADYGSFGCMYRLLQEVWRAADDPPFSPTNSEPAPHSSQSSSATQDGTLSPGAASTPGMREIKKQQVHWRDIMKRNKWQFLFI